MLTRGFEITSRDGGTVVLSSEQIEALGAQLRGRLLREGDDAWDDAVLIWNGMVATTPALVVQPTTAQDVATTIAFARDHGILLSIKGGGHNIAGTAIAPGGLTLDMALMRDVTVDPQTRLAHVGPGCRLQDVDRETQTHGLATVLGFISETGVAGLTLGGGLGYLTRRFGWAVDNLQEVQIVCADGTIRTANRTENADLLWAVRGGGGNFGVVTRFTFQLHEVGPIVHGGLIAWPIDRAHDILRAYRTFTAVAPRELAVWLVFLTAPPAPFVPEEWRGRRVCAMSVCFSGDLTDTDRVLAPIRALGTPIIDLLTDWPYTQQQSYLDDTEPKGAHYYWKTEFLADLNDDLVAIVEELGRDCPIPDGQIGFLHLAGVLNERAPDDGAVGNRQARYAIGVNGMWNPGDPDAEAYRHWIRDAWTRIRSHSVGNYVNFQTADGDQSPADAYDTNYERLRRIKKTHDPENLFRVNRNIPPA